MEVIGVNHGHESVRNAVVAYIDRKYPKLENILVELYPNLEPMREAGINISPWFSALAEIYDRKEVVVITADINRFRSLSLTVYEARSMILQNPLKYLLLERWNLWKAVYFRGKFFEERSEGLYQVMETEHPELCVVGGIHAMHIKQKKPDVTFTLFEVQEKKRISALERRMIQMADDVNYVEPDKKSK